MLEARDISFAYSRRPILDGATFPVASGEAVALVGANGAGKTTLMRVLAGLLFPMSGTLKTDGFDAFREPIRFRRQLGYLPESAPSEPGLTVKAYLKFRAKLTGEQVRRIRHCYRVVLSFLTESQSVHNHQNCWSFSHSSHLCFIQGSIPARILIIQLFRLEYTAHNHSTISGNK